MQDRRDLIEKYGAAKCDEVWRLMETSQSPSKVVMDVLGVDRSEAMNVLMAIMAAKQGEMQVNVSEAMTRYAANQHKLPSCPKAGCDGKLHETVSRSSELSGLLNCDSCRAIFKRKSD